MTLVVPQMADNKRLASAPAEQFSVISLDFKPFSEACLGPDLCSFPQPSSNTTVVLD
jgi:hypothetical protein